MYRFTLITLLLLTSALLGYGEDAVSISVELDHKVLARGTPVMMRIVLQNKGQSSLHLAGAIGWGNGIEIMRAEPDGMFRSIPPDVPHEDTDLGPIYSPPHCFVGEVQQGKKSSIIYLLSTEQLPLGATRFKARIGYNGKIIESQEVVLELTEEQNADSVFSRSDKREVFRLARQLHNYFGHTERKGGKSSDYFMNAIPYVEKALQTQAKSKDVEYALYVGVLLSLRADVDKRTAQMSESTLSNMKSRFDGSWTANQSDKARGMLKRLHPEVFSEN